LPEVKEQWEKNAGELRLLWMSISFLSYEDHPPRYALRVSPQLSVRPMNPCAYSIETLLAGVTFEKPGRDSRRNQDLEGEYHEFRYATIDHPSRLSNYQS
jgi:hypothetical protein